MKDPRLAEIEFLMDVERAESLWVRTTVLAESSGATSKPNSSSPWNMYGLPVERFRDMVVHLLVTEAIVGPVRRGDNHNVNEDGLAGERKHLTHQAISSQRLQVQLSHAGRIHLWNLRDALMKDPDMDPFGLRSKAAWSRDLPVRLLFATNDEPLAMIFLDLDFFGLVNKNLGHPVGDAVLLAAFTLIKNLVGSRGAAYRCGGEEVGVLMPGVTHAAATELAEQLRSMIEHDVHRQVQQLTGPQTASIGVATFNGPLTDVAAVKVADDRMQTAKRAGRNRVVATDS
jgi:diguanylate cyclase (GGDEF)-like protein